jgi:Flp pilus assembly pilin Flp
MKSLHRRRRGQTMVEYIIIVAIVAIAAIAVVGFFGDTIRQKFFGATEELGGDAGERPESGSSQQGLKDLGQE